MDIKTHDLMPTFTLSFMPNVNHIFQLTHESYRTYPSYWNLQNSVIRTDKYNITLGDPHTKYSRTNYTDFRYILYQSMSIGVSYMYVKNNLLSQTYMMPDTLLRVTQWLNIGKTQFASAYLSFPVSIMERFSSNLYLEIIRQQYQSDDWFGLSFDNRFWQRYVYFNTYTTLSVKPKIVLGINFKYHSSGYVAMKKYDGYCAVDTYLKGSFMDERLVFSLSCNDIFESHNYNRYCYQLGQNWEEKSNYYLRSFRIAATYKFKGYKERQTRNIDTSRFRM